MILYNIKNHIILIELKIIVWIVIQLEIEINTSDQILPPNRAIFDTPGIDAADEADRLMTESAMHLIDQLYYVMDYNHVQSEVNLYFLQEMQKQSVPIY